MSRATASVLARHIRRLVLGHGPDPGTDAALPERYRGPVVLCWLEGRTQPEAAQMLNTSLSTLRRCLEHGKQLLQARLARRGLTLAGAMVVPALAIPAQALAGAVRRTAATA